MSPEPVLFTALNFDISFLTKNTFLLEFFHIFFVFLVNISSYLFIFLKLFKVLCYSYLTFDWLPMINPYIWPFAFFRLSTRWYFDLFEKFFPTLIVNQNQFEISTIVALELLNSLVYFLVRSTNFFVSNLENIEKVL